MSNKFYDIQPGDGSHYVCLNGQPIARFDHLPKAESLRDSLMRRQVQEGGYISIIVKEDGWAYIYLDQQFVGKAKPQYLYEAGTKNL